MVCWTSRVLLPPIIRQGPFLLPTSFASTNVVSNGGLWACSLGTKSPGKEICGGGGTTTGMVSVCGMEDTSQSLDLFRTPFVQEPLLFINQPKLYSW